MAGIIAGASSFLGAATLANSRGFAATQSTIFGNNTGGLDAGGLLDAGRRINRSGIGLSGSARQANARFLSSASSNANTLFSLAVGQTSSVEALQTTILALRSQTPTSQLARSLVEDNGAVSASTIGTEIDTEA